MVTTHTSALNQHCKIIPAFYSYLMKKLGKRSYYFGKVSEKRHGPCKIWTKTHDVRNN